MDYPGGSEEGRNVEEGGRLSARRFSVRKPRPLLALPEEGCGGLGAGKAQEADSPEPPGGNLRQPDLSPVTPAQTSDLPNHDVTHLCCLKSHLLQQLETPTLFLGERPRKHRTPALFTIASQSLCFSICPSLLSLPAFTSFAVYRERDTHPTSPEDQPGTRETDSPWRLEVSKPRGAP